MKNLDAMDRSILRALQENGRLTNTELADRINLADGNCRTRQTTDP